MRVSFGELGSAPGQSVQQCATRSSLLVPSPQIIQLIEDESGRCVSAYDLVGDDAIAALQLYKRLHLSRKTGEVQILCALCGVQVYLCGTPDKEHYFFKHFQEDGSCPAITRGQLSEAQINALRFHNQRESSRHKRLKSFLDESLRADPGFSTPVIEGTWKGRVDKEFRRPDVRSRFRDQVDIAFEVQLSTTFGRVMAEREVFYKREGGLLLWILGDFEYEQDRLMMQVVYANNNRNVFVVNDATRDASLAAGALVLECRWAKPHTVGKEVHWTPQRSLVRFDALTLDLEKQRAFYFDAEAAEARLLAEVEEPPLVERIETFWLAYECFQGRERPDVSVLNQQWEDAGRRCREKGWVLPSRHDDDFIPLIRALYSAKHGASVGWNYKDLWGVAHRVHDAHKSLLWLVIPALAHYARLGAIEAQDNHGKWAGKMSDWQEGIATRTPTYLEDHRFDAIVVLAFPELTALIPVDQDAF